MKPTRTYGFLQFVKKEVSHDQWVEEVMQIENYEIRYNMLRTDSDWGQPGYYFRLTKVEPHVCIALKSHFEKLSKSNLDNFYFAHTDSNCRHLLWFMDLYPMQMDVATEKKLKSGKSRFLKMQRTIELILSENYVPTAAALNEPYVPRPYQQKGAEISLQAKKMLLLDELGLGKSLTSILPCVVEPKKTLPVLIVCQTHLPSQ